MLRPLQGLVRPQAGAMVGWTGVYYANNNTVAYYATDPQYYVPNSSFFKLGMSVRLRSAHEAIQVS